MESASLDLNSLKIGGQLIQTYAEMVTTAHSWNLLTTNWTKN